MKISHVDDMINFITIYFIVYGVVGKEVGLEPLICGIFK